MDSIDENPSTSQVIQTSKRSYSGLIDYADQQGAPVDAFIANGWHEVIHKGRPALEYPTPTGNRGRYLDGLEPRHYSPTNYEASWYGLPQALEIGQGDESRLATLVLVNGAAGVIVAQYQGFPAISVSDGEQRTIPDSMIEELKAAGVTEIVIAQDCDKTGRESAAKRARQFLEAGFIVRAVDLQLGEAGDIADFCKVHGQDWSSTSQAKERLADLPEIPPLQPTRPPIQYSGAGGDRRDEFISTIVIPSLQRAVTTGRGKHFPCINPDHDDEHPSARIGKARNGGMAYYCSCGTHSLFTVARWLGLPTYREWLRETYPQEARRKKSKSHTPQAVTIAQRVQSVEAPALSGEIMANTRFVSEIETDLLKYAALLIKSAIGTGKTELVKRILAALEIQLGRQPRVLVITHRQALAADIARRLDIECYKAIDTEWLRSAPQLVIVYNSLRHLARVGETLPSYDLLIIDEIEQFHRHLFSGTFRGGEAKRAYEIARQLVKECPHVVCLDAHAGAISQQWLAGVKGEVTTLVNTYRLDRGKLTLHADKSTVIAHGLALIEAGQTPVVFPTSSRKVARQIQRILTERLGSDEGIRLVYRDNSESQDSQAFIAHINTELPMLKALIYTPSLGTGIDITAPVKAVCGVFGREPLDARDCLQMIGRCRTAEQTHVYVQPAEGSQETDANAIYRRHEQNAISTGDHCAFDAHGIYDVTPTQQSILKLFAMCEADHNRLTNDPLSWFVALAQDEGYTLDYHEGENRAIADALKQAGETIAQADKESVLAAESVSHEALEIHRANGTLTPEVRAGHERFKIEDTVGQTISPDIYDDLHTPQEREKLRRFTDLHDTDEEMKERDRKQAADEHLLSKRGHYTRRRALVKTAIHSVFGEAGLGSTDELTSAEIEARITDFMTLHTEDLKRLYGWRSDQSQKPVAIFRWLLAQVGIKLASRQVMRDRQRFYVYFIDRQHLEKQRAYAQTRLAHLANLKSKADYLNHGYRDIPRALSDPPSCHQPPGEGWREIPLQKPAPRPFAPVGRGASKFNPFSQPNSAGAA